MLTLYHAPQSRSSRVLWLLEELGAEYRIAYMDIPRADGSGAPDPENPHPDKKVPALDHDGELVTESAAIFLYLTDLLPKAELAPQVGAPGRGAYLTWLFYYAGVFEPVTHFEMLGIGDNPRLCATFRGRAELDERLFGALNRSPYLLGDRFSAADILYASVGHWLRSALPPGEAVDAYLRRCVGRPAFEAALKKDAPASGAV